MKRYHSLLQRQINKSKWVYDEKNPEWLVLLDLINESYLDFDEEKMLLERSIEISSREYQENIATTQHLQAQLIHQEKMAGIGQLSAGVAHEVNNPLGYVLSNMDMLGKYAVRMSEMCSMNQKIINSCETLTLNELIALCQEVRTYNQCNKMDYIFDDLSELVRETTGGLLRIEKIVKSLLSFSRRGTQDEMSIYDINDGIRDTLVISNNEIKYCATVEMDLGIVPGIQIYAGEINQVLLNLLVNAAHAIKSTGEMGVVRIRTFADPVFVYCEISDDGIGIAKDALEKIFEPFYTTKPIGTGTGLGLSIAHDIIVNKHHGEIIVHSEVGEGTTFTIKLPIEHNAGKQADKRSR